jgi:hypothetical protein
MPGTDPFHHGRPYFHRKPLPERREHQPVGVSSSPSTPAATPSGLPVIWPRTAAQEPINVKDRKYDPLYPYGYGLHTRQTR